MRKILLTQGKFALVDDEDYERVSMYKWCVRQNDENHLYAQRAPSKECHHRHLHHFVLKTDSKVDHINGDGLDNRRCNLRIATQQQNTWNSRRTKSRKLPKGVFKSSKNRFSARIRVNRKLIYLGCYKTSEEAARTYDTALRKIAGEFARPNYEVS